MDVRQLKYFVQIVDSGSLAKASRQLFIAQPALSQQMARLEMEVGKALLLRSSRGVSATENGKALYHHARFLLRQMEQAIAIARQDRSALSGRVALGLAPTTLCRLGMPLLLHLRAKYPGLMLNVIEGLSGYLEQMTRNSQFDVALLFSADVAPDMASEPLLEEELYLIVPVNSPLVPRNRMSLSLREVADLPLFLSTPLHGLRRRIALEFERVNLPMKLAGEVDSLPMLMACVARGLGATIAPMAATHVVEGDAKQWRCLRISDARLTRTSYLYSLPPQQIPDCARVVRDEICSLVRDLVNANAWQGARLLVDGPVELPDARERAALVS